MSIQDPQPGECFHVTIWGCDIEIQKRGHRKDWGDAVWIRLIRDPGERHFSRPERTLSMRGWPEFVRWSSMRPAGTVDEV